MKKISIALCLICFLVFVSCGFTAPVGNPNFHLPGQSALTTSVEVDVINDGDLTYTESSGYTEKMEYESFNSALLKIGFMPIKENNFQLYTRLGMAEADLVFIEGGSIDTNSGFAWGGGASGTFFSFGNGTEIGFDISYLAFNNDVERFVIIQTDDFDINMELEYEEFEAALAISKDMEWVNPYLGLKYSDVQMTIPATNPDDVQSEIKNEDNIGLFLGFDFLISNDTTFNLEARFLDKTAVSIMFHFGF